MYRLILYHQGKEIKRSKPRPAIEDWLITNSYFLWPADRHEIIEEEEE